ncbi:MAG: hypothetical protein IKD36_00585 [Clostridia bacterium]|nr:hypothetical protein [Clostridia bacterium]
MKVSKVLLNIMSVVCFVYGALYTFSLVFIPVGIYCFIAGRRFSYKAEHLDNTIFMSNEDFKKYVIFSSIACFPLGLLSIIPYVLIAGNKIKITNPAGLHVQSHDEKFDSEVKIESVEEKSEEKSDEPNKVEAQKDDELSEEEKQAKFEKLKNFREKGIITEEELELAREQLFGKK